MTAKPPRRVVIVTGAGKGLGCAFAELWAESGACVLVNNRRRPDEASSADAVVSAIKAGGGEAIAEYSDVRSPEAPTAMIGAALKAWGRVDVLILNAGVNGPAARLDAPNPPRSGR